MCCWWKINFEWSAINKLRLCHKKTCYLTFLFLELLIVWSKVTVNLLTVACIEEFGGSFRFFFVCALDIFKVWWEESFFCKKHFCSNKCKNGNLPKKKEVINPHHPSRTFKKTWRSHSYVLGNCFTLSFPFFCFIKVNSFFPNNACSSA